MGRPKPFIELAKMLQAANIFTLEDLDEPTSLAAGSKKIVIEIVRPNPSSVNNG